MLAGLVTALLATPRSADAVGEVQDPDRNSADLTAWGWHTNATPATVKSFVGKGYRIIDLEVNSASPRFSVAYVKNSGSYARGWWWYYGQTIAKVKAKLAAKNARLVDIEAYSTSAGRRYAVVMVSNTGPALKGWGWHYGVKLSTITNYVSTHNVRVIDVDRYATSNGPRYAAIYIANTGVDAKPWWHYYNATKAQLVSALKTNRARLIDLERRSNGRYDAVMQQGSGEYWWWVLGQSTGQLSAFAAQHGARIYKINPYVKNGKRYFNALLINDVNAETSRVRALVESKMKGSWGFYLKQVGGPTVVSLNAGTVFEPASMIKIVHAVTALRDVQKPSTSTTLNTNVTWYARPSDPARYPGSPGYGDDKNKCAYKNDGTLITTKKYVDKLGSVIVKNMMQQSDNRTTDAVTRKYGFSKLNTTIAVAGMTKSKLHHRIGCPAKSSPQPWKNNKLTLVDAGKIYEKVENLTLLDATRRDALYGFMSGGPIGDGALKDMIIAEANAAGLSAADRDLFVSRVVARSKGGSYGLCPKSGNCDPKVIEDRTVGGTIWLPTRSRAGGIVDNPFVYGRFFNTTFNCTFDAVDDGNCSSYNKVADGIGVVGVEMFRLAVRQALATW